MISTPMRTARVFNPLYISFFLLMTAFPAAITAQMMTAAQLLEKSIAYHDPQGSWLGFQGNFSVQLAYPDGRIRRSGIALNFPKDKFELKIEEEGQISTYIVQGDSCDISFNGRTEFTETERDSFHLDCKRGKLLKNYYTYLYGLPMKLRDPGTLLDSIVKAKSFRGKEYLVMKVEYEKQVGQDIWYFYFNPSTYALQAYQFFHDETKNDGEYILLEDTEEINGIKIPKIRSWYLNKNDTYLGTDTLLK